MNKYIKLILNISVTIILSTITLACFHGLFIKRAVDDIVQAEIENDKEKTNNVM